MGTRRCLLCCTKALFAATLIFAAASTAFAAILADSHNDYRLQRCSEVNVTCSAWLEEVHPRHILIIDSLLPSLLGSGLVMLAALVSLRQRQEHTALTIHLVALPVLALAIGFTSKALCTYESNNLQTDVYMSLHHILYCGVLYATVFMLVISIVILALKQHQEEGGMLFSTPAPATLRRANSCEIVRTRNPSNARSPILAPKNPTNAGSQGNGSSSAPTSAASTRPGSRVALLSNQAGMATRVPATSMESVLYCVRESNDEHVAGREHEHRKESFVMMSDTLISGAAGGAGSHTAGPSAAPISSSPVTNASLLKMEKISRRSFPPPPGTPSESAW
eukprot:scpid14945/ scgid16589/ 